MNPSIVCRNLFARLWHSPIGGFIVAVAAVLLTLVPNAAHAQSATSFDSVGQNMMKAVCGFIQSPIVTVIVAVALVALLVAATVNEDNGLISKLLKVLIAGLALVGLVSVMTLLGFNMAC